MSRGCGPHLIKTVGKIRTVCLFFKLLLFEDLLLLIAKECRNNNE